MATKRSRTTKKSKSRAATTAKKAPVSKRSSTKQAAAVIELAPEHRAELKRLTDGAVDTKTILLRPDLDIGEFLTNLAGLAKTRMARRTVGNKNPNGGMWV